MNTNNPVGGIFRFSCSGLIMSFETNLKNNWFKKNLVRQNTYLPQGFFLIILKTVFLVCNQSLDVSHPRRLDPTMKLMTYTFVLYLQHGRHDVKCKPSIPYLYVYADRLFCAFFYVSYLWRCSLSFSLLLC